jgi:beta-glucosidase
LASKLVVPYIEGVQSQGVMATVKHWVLNNQEYNRSSISASADERTSFEIYYPPFRAAVDAGVYAVMCSYNKVNGTYACENDAALNRDLKQRMGFKGLVMSDWGATHSTELAANSGLDMEQPDAKYFGDTLKQAVTSGKVPTNRLDDMIKRILVPMFQVGIFDNPRTGNATKDAQSEEHVKLAKQLSEASTVLLQNNGILPLNADTIKKIAVIGMDAGPQTIVAGRGSGHVIPPYTVTPLKGITNRVPKAQVTYSDGQSLQDAARTAKDADVAIVFIATDSGEGKDRADLTFGNQDQLVQTIAMAQPNTIVVAHAPGSVLMPWSANVKAILCAFLPGQESGNAIASVLFGDVNPSARLPLTFPASATQLPLKTREQYPGVNGVATYTEKLLVGYRWYDDQKEIPRFAFGHGLSYTNFVYSNLEVLASQCGGHVRVLVNITNTGKVSGAEIAQLYLGYPKEAGEPPQVLRGFKKVVLKPGESQRIEFDSLEQEKDLSIWDVVESQWKIIKGTWKVFVGASSRDIRAESGFINMDDC